MKDLGIKPAIVDAVRRFLAHAPKHELAPLAVTLSDAADRQGGMSDALADACDAFYSRVIAFDADGDGEIEAHESTAHEELDEVLQAFRENDRDGYTLDTMPAASKPVAVADQPRVRAAFDLPRRALVLTLWSSRGARYAFEQSRARIDAIKPDGVLLHTDPVALANGGGAQLTKDVRAAFPSLKIGWAIYGDSYGVDPSAVWARCARAAFASDVETLMLNCEVAWKSPKRGNLEARQALAHKAVQAVRNAAPSLHVSFTSYDGPCSILRPDKRGHWGGHGSFPWRGFLGEGTDAQGQALGVHADCPQVYLAGADTGTGASYDAAISREQRAWFSRKEAVRKGMIAPAIEHWLYLQAHSSTSSAIGYLGTQARVTCAWAFPTRADVQGVEALRALSALNRANHRSVAAFQRSDGLAPDGRMGAATVSRLLT